ncbi:hypothetical protein L2E82_43101 [Cichorium intybus]|uniref:Uncharacterized protein n=1 Tax=Cichorium intybus TaxID=13427 RepID=A0ACB8ZN40_CICIN|nr:hypothetical protein L2E82_43101 [Cichorium intybus]
MPTPPSSSSSSSLTVIDADALIEKHLVTLDEALHIANTVVLMALNVVSILTCKKQKRTKVRVGEKKPQHFVLYRITSEGQRCSFTRRRRAGRDKLGVRGIWRGKPWGGGS